MSQEIDRSLFPTAEDRKNAQSAWDAGKNAADSENPVGTFQAVIREAELGRSASSDRLQIKYKIEIASGEFQGKCIMKYDGLETPQQAKITQQQLARLGVDVQQATMETLPAILLSLLDRPIVISCKKNGQYYNIYFQRRIQEGAGVPTASKPQVPGAPAATGIPGKKF